MENHNVEVYTNKEEICGGLGFEPNVNKIIEIDDEIMIIYYDNGLIEVEYDDKMDLYHDNIEKYMEDGCDEDIQYFYRYEFSLEKYL